MRNRWLNQMVNRKCRRTIMIGGLSVLLTATAACQSNKPAEKETTAVTTAAETEEEKTSEAAEETTEKEGPEKGTEKETTEIENASEESSAGTEKEDESAADKESEDASNESESMDSSEADDAEGWHTDSKGTYYLKDGEKLTGIVDLTEEINEQKGNKLNSDMVYIYAFDKDGYVQPEGWLEVDGEKYYVTESGWLYTNVATIDDVSYAFTSEGKLTTGLRFFVTPEEFGLFYYEKEGRIANEFRTVGAKVFYFGEDGAAVSGWQEIDGKNYFFGRADSQDMLAGYMMVIGEVKIDGKEYTFDADGTLIKGERPKE